MTLNPMTDPLVELLEVSKTYGDDKAPVHALREISLAISRGERVALLGKSGSGKSTLLNLIAGLDRLSSGKISVSGRVLSEISNNEFADYRRECVGMIFQSFHLVPWRTALQNVELPLVFAGRAKAARQAAARDALETVGLAERMTHRPQELSGGEQQRVAIARALVNRPQLLLADEPTGNLDSSTAEEIVKLLLRCNEESQTAILLVTHDEDLAHRFATQVLRMRDGQFESGSKGGAQ